jgi:hypothetical protein
MLQTLYENAELIFWNHFPNTFSHIAVNILFPIQKKTNRISTLKMENTTLRVTDESIIIIYL